MGGFFNRLYYGKAGKADYTPDDLPSNRFQLFFEVLRVRFWSLCRVNLMQVVFWLPVIVWTYINVLALQGIDVQMVERGGEARAGGGVGWGPGGDMAGAPARLRRCRAGERGVHLRLRRGGRRDRPLQGHGRGDNRPLVRPGRAARDAPARDLRLLGAGLLVHVDNRPAVTY